MKLPKVVKIRGHKYQIHHCPPEKSPKSIRKELVERSGSNSFVAGFTKNSSGLIYVNSQQGDRAKLTTLFHEIIHTLDYNYCMGELLRGHGKSEEMVIDSLAYAFLEFLEGNPEIWKLLKKR